MYEQHFSRWKYPAVNPVAERRPDSRNQELHHECLCKVYYRHKAVAHQGNLKISNHIHNTQGHQLGKKHISRLQIADFQPAVRAREEKQQYKINSNNQYMSLEEEFQSQIKTVYNRVVIPEPDISINCCF